MDFSRTEEKKYAEPVVNRTHPPIVQTAVVAGLKNDLPAGTVMIRDGGYWYPYDANSESPGVPAGVLMQSVSAGKNDTISSVLRHGIVRGDVLTPSDPDTIAKLERAGIFVDNPAPQQIADQ